MHELEGIVRSLKASGSSDGARAVVVDRVATADTETQYEVSPCVWWCAQSDRTCCLAENSRQFYHGERKAHREKTRARTHTQVEDQIAAVEMYMRHGDAMEGAC